MTRRTLSTARAPLALLAAGAALAFAPVLAVAPAQAQSTPFRLELEGGAAWQTRNDFAVPGDTGTRLSLDAAPATASFRAALHWDFGARWSARLVAAPLATETDFVPAQEVRFDGTTFAAGRPLTQRFEFNSYRLTLYRRFTPAGAWSFRAGLTAKVRDARIELAGEQGSARRDDLGVVPLLHGAARWDGGGRWAFEAEADALGSPQGRAIDVSARLELRASERVRPYLAWRLLDGGADNDEVYTFATVQYALAGVSLRF